MLRSYRGSTRGSNAIRFFQHPARNPADHWPFLKSHSESEERIAELKKEQARLSADAQSSRAAIAEADARASEAQQKANEADLARVKLELQLAPRRLSGDQKAALIEALKPFAGTEVQLWTFPPGTADTSPLANSIYQVLLDAGWKPHRFSSISGQAMPGITASFKVGSGSLEAVRVLIESVSNIAGFDVQMAAPYSEEPNLGAAMSDETGPIKATVIIIVGTKP